MSTAEEISNLKVQIEQWKQVAEAEKKTVSSLRDQLTGVRENNEMVVRTLFEKNNALQTRCTELQMKFDTELRRLNEENSYLLSKIASYEKGQHNRDGYSGNGRRNEGYYDNNQTHSSGNRRDDDPHRRREEEFRRYEADFRREEPNRDSRDYGNSNTSNNRDSGSFQQRQQQPQQRVFAGSSSSPGTTGLVPVGGDEYNRTYLYVRPLPVDLTSKHLMNTFSEFGTVVHAKVRTPPKESKYTFGFVCFKTPESAAHAIDILSGKADFDGMVFYVKYADKAFIPPQHNGANVGDGDDVIPLERKRQRLSYADEGDSIGRIGLDGGDPGK